MYWNKEHKKIRIILNKYHDGENKFDHIKITLKINGLIIPFKNIQTGSPKSTIPAYAICKKH